MYANRLMLLLRSLLLAGVLVFFIIRLGDILLTERQRNQFLSNTDVEIGYDPGIRVLLLDRSTKKPHHRRLEILILQACILFCPDDPTLQIPLDPQEIITIQTSLDGLQIDCKQQEENWNVTQIDIQPSYTSLLPKHGSNSGRQSTAFEAKDRKPVFALNRTRYRGNLSIIKKGSQKLYAVNSLPIESYLEGVVPSEMPSKYPSEALLAQAIASRSYAYAQILDANRQGNVKVYDVYDTVQSQEYLGTTKENPNTTIAVRKTAGHVLTYNDACFPAYFCASSGGLLTPIRFAFPESIGTDGHTKLDAVMVGKEDPYCKQGVDELKKEHTHWKRTIYLLPKEIKDSIRKWLDERRDTRNIGWVQDVTVSNNLPGRVEEVTVHTSERGVQFVFSGQQFRTDIIGPNNIRSTYWEKGSPKWNEDKKSYEITSYGWGHGVGMSQVSAYAMAKLHGMSAQQILSFFYEQARLSKRWKALSE